MPELPEVETIVRGLRPDCVGQRITGVTLKWKRHIGAPGPARFAGRIQGQTITAVERRGKYLVFRLTTDTLLIHLKMSGDLRVVKAAEPLNKHDHTRFHFASGRELRFNDTRKFGKVYLVRDTSEITGGLGPEPLAESFTAKTLAGILHSRRRRLKALLLDQTALVGVGNIYADESLHRAKLHPLRLSHTLTDPEVRALWRSIRHTLTLAIQNHGSSIDWMYRGGEHQNHLRAYDREGLPCPVCKTPIRRILAAQRSTHFCPNCQQL